MDKNELNAPDAFISTSQRVFDWIEHHRKTFGAIIAIALVGSLGWLAYDFMKARSEKAAANALYAPQAELRKAESKVRDERAKKMQEMGKLSAKEKMQIKPETLRPVNYGEDFAPAVEQLKAQIRANASTKVALIAAMNLSNFLLEQKQFSEALSVLELPRLRPSMSDLLGGFFAMHKGLTLLENQKYDDAEKVYQSVLDSKALKSFHSEALLKLGISHERKGDATKARETFERVSRDFPESEAANSAQQYLRLMDLKG